MLKDACRNTVDIGNQTLHLSAQCRPDTLTSTPSCPLFIFVLFKIPWYKIPWFKIPWYKIPWLRVGVRKRLLVSGCLIITKSHYDCSTLRSHPTHRPVTCALTHWASVKSGQNTDIVAHTYPHSLSLYLTPTLSLTHTHTHTHTQLD